MSEQKNKHEIIYQAGGQEVKLNPSIVHQFITKGNADITMQEAVNFMQLCRYSELNPFLNEAYLIKYSAERPADMVVSKEAFMKRASRNKQFNGYKAGVIVETKDGDIKYKNGQFVSSKEKLVGAYAKVFKKDIDYPFEVEVGLEEYNTYKSTWKKMPANMIRKVALVNALREAFPETLGAMYTEDEPNQSDFADNSAVKDESVVQSETNLLEEYKKKLEEEKEQVEQHEKETEETIEVDAAEEVDTTHMKKAEEIEEEGESDDKEEGSEQGSEQGSLFKGNTLSTE